MAKLADFGLARNLKIGDNYKIAVGVERPVPIAYSAPESIRHCEFSSASDVWSYGVLLWEIFTYADKPWLAEYGNDKSEVERAVCNFGRCLRLLDTNPAPEGIRTLIFTCFSFRPGNRPQFSNVLSHLENLLSDAAPIQAFFSLETGADYQPIPPEAKSTESSAVEMARPLHAYGCPNQGASSSSTAAKSLEEGAMTTAENGHLAISDNEKQNLIGGLSTTANLHFLHKMLIQCHQELVIQMKNICT